ncbi:MAG: hypothetical protein HYZ71_11480 [Deltaproteobacteria bacterium]|nr:hypothetical protein [Deltaproteobacteria bacterium]
MFNRNALLASVLFLLGSSGLNADVSTCIDDPKVIIAVASVCTEECQSVYASALVDCDLQVGPLKLACQQNAQVALQACLKACI